MFTLKLHVPSNIEIITKRTQTHSLTYPSVNSHLSRRIRSKVQKCILLMMWSQWSPTGRQRLVIVFNFSPRYCICRLYKRGLYSSQQDFTWVISRTLLLWSMFGKYYIRFLIKCKKSLISHGLCLWAKHYISIKIIVMK